MADKDDEFMDTDEAGAAEAGEKEGGKKGSPFASAMLMQILKWAAIVVGLIVFVVTIVVVVVNIMGAGGSSKEDERVLTSPEYSTKPMEGDWYSEIPEFRGETNDNEGSKSMYIVKLHLLYTKADKVTEGEIISKTIMIQDNLMTWFSRQTGEYLRSINNRESIRETLRQEINRLLNRPILDIRFTKYEIPQL